ncbi:MAG: HPF/RaiA family ribosome-associated protein [Xanthobacteraceae bacterium]
MQGTPAIEEAIATHVAKLEEFWGRITACRVVLKAPSQHHRKGGMRSISVSRFPTAAR